jgi:tetratricopeptide (TPR) repeat protein
MPTSKRGSSSPGHARAPQDVGARKRTSLQTPARPPGGRSFARKRFQILAAIAGGALVITFAALRTRHAGGPAAGSVGVAAAPSPLSSEEQALRTAAALRPGDSQARRALGRYLLDAGHPLEALWHFLAAEEVSPADRAARIDAARALTRAGLPELARRDLASLAAAHHAGADLPIALAEAELAMAQPQAAEEALVQAGPAVARSAAAQLILGDARTAAGDAGGAEAAYRRAVALEPQDAVAWDRLGRLALAAGDWGAAKNAFTAARDRAPRDAGHSYRLGLALWRLGERDNAEGLWQVAATLSPGYAPAHLALGKLYRDRGESRAAAVALVAAVRADPTWGEAQRTLAEVMTALGDRASALYQLGTFDLASDQPHRALAKFRKIVQIAPQRVDGPRMASVADAQMQRLDRGAAEARQGLELHPDDTGLLRQLGTLYVLTNNRPEARTLCERWLKLDPSAVEPVRILSQIAREEQRLPEARRLGEQALAKAPNDAAVCDELSRTLSQMPGSENARRALDLARRATDRNPQVAEYWRQLGVLLMTAGQPEEAAGALLHALERDLGSVASCGPLVPIAAQEKRPQTARFFASLVTELEARARTGKSLWRDVYSHPADAAAHARLARFLLTDGDLRRARNQLRQVAAIHPKDAAARRGLAVVERLLDLKAE